MLVIEIAGDALVKNGEFVILGRVPLAIAQANGAENMLDAERKLFSRINAGVQQGKLNPLHPENLTPLPRGDYGIGIVPFDELVEWGNATKLFEFRRPINPAVAIKPLAGSGATRAPAPITPVSGRAKNFRPTQTTVPPDWTLWRIIPRVRVWQACLLSLNIDPDFGDATSNDWDRVFYMNRFGSLEMGDTLDSNFATRLRQLSANLGDKEFFTQYNRGSEDIRMRPVALSEFVTWAVSRAKWGDYRLNFSHWHRNRTRKRMH